MMSAKSYIDHAKQQRIFVESYRYSPYWWGNSDCDEIVKNMDLALLNLCKAILSSNGIDFNGRTPEEIIKYTSTNGLFYSEISTIEGHRSFWEHAARRRDRTSKNFQLGCVTNCLESLENHIIREYNIK